MATQADIFAQMLKTINDQRTTDAAKAKQERENRASTLRSQRSGADSQLAKALEAIEASKTSYDTSHQTQLGLLDTDYQNEQNNIADALKAIEARRTQFDTSHKTQLGLLDTDYSNAKTALEAQLGQLEAQRGNTQTTLADQLTKDVEGMRSMVDTDVMRRGIARSDIGTNIAADRQTELSSANTAALAEAMLGYDNMKNEQNQTFNNFQSQYNQTKANALQEYQNAMLDYDSMNTEQNQTLNTISSQYNRSKAEAAQAYQDALLNFGNQKSTAQVGFDNFLTDYWSQVRDMKTDYSSSLADVRGNYNENYTNYLQGLLAYEESQKAKKSGGGGGGKKKSTTPTTPPKNPYKAPYTPTQATGPSDIDLYTWKLNELTAGNKAPTKKTPALTGGGGGRYLKVM